MLKPERLVPWTRAGAPDLDYDDRFRAATHALLTHPDLLTYFRQLSPREADKSYEEVIRDLEFVWDCPDDGMVNMTGHRCPVCARSKAEAGMS
jgi:hypothetical protein